MSEQYTDTERLEVLMQHPDKLWIDGSGPSRLYSGADVDGEVGRGLWREDPRDAVDDIIRRLKSASAEATPVERSETQR